MTDHNEEMLIKVARANGHQLDDCTPEEDELALANCEATMQVARKTTCPHCDVIAEPIPAGGLRWVVQEHHELHCPKHDENTPGLHRDVELYPPTKWAGDTL